MRRVHSLRGVICNEILYFNYKMLEVVFCVRYKKMSNKTNSQGIAMQVGVPRERLAGETRVAASPSSVGQ
ncbi:NAD(P)(+) transhydrogenase (Re/Si-specific) subunit alpha, partial [Vibrio parahaemolyticus]|nr:NAD(P)(+) transhydrogenase (Re/Si-specific) subunit alpha [Vibrio parahaemolyticus]